MSPFVCSPVLFVLCSCLIKRVVSRFIYSISSNLLQFVIVGRNLVTGLGFHIFNRNANKKPTKLQTDENDFCSSVRQVCNNVLNTCRKNSSHNRVQTVKRISPYFEKSRYE